MSKFKINCLIQSILSIGIILIPLISVNSDSITIEDEMYKYRTKRGWDELNNIHHFEKAEQTAQKAIEKIQSSSDPQIKALLPDWKNRLQATKNRIITYKDLKANIFPIGPILSNSYETHHIFNPGFKTAVEQTMNEVKEVLRQISIREGQVSVLFVQKGIHPHEVEEVAYRKLEGIPYYNPIPVEDQIELFGEILTYEKIYSNPDILSGFFRNEKWERLYVISIEKLNVHMDKENGKVTWNESFKKLYYLFKNKQENEAYYDISIFKYNKNDTDKLTHLAIMDTTGVYTGEYFNSSFLQAIILCIISFIVIIGFIFYSYIRKINNDSETENNEEENNKEKDDIKPHVNPEVEKKILTFLDNFDLKQFLKLSTNSLLFLLLGLGFSFGIGIGSEVIIGSWTENIGSLEFKTIIILFLLNLFIYPTLLVILFKIADYVIVVKQKFYLPILFISFSLGIAIYMHLYIEFYNKIFYLEDRVFFVILQFIGTILNGLILGETYKEAIDLNSKKRFFYVDEKGEKINHPPFRLLLRFGVFIILILLCSSYGVVNFYLFLKTNIAIFIPYSLPLCMCLILLAIKFTKKDFQIPNLNSSKYKNADNFEKPHKLNQLLEYLTNPDLIPYQVEEINFIPEIQNSLIHCMKDEGGVILISGGKWSGKKRILNEVLQDSHFRNRTEFKIICTSKVESKFLPFIEGMKNIPQIESILENIKIGKNTKKAADLLSNIFSVIPIAGGLISKFLESDIDLTSKENEKYILDTLATTVQEISIELQTLSGGRNRGGQDRDQILFLLDNFQDVDESTLHVMEKIREHLKDPVLSPETNYVAFVLFLNNDSRFLREDVFKNSDLLKPYKHFNVHGLKYDAALHYFRDNLNFAANRNNDELFTKIFEIYSEELKIENELVRYISPKYILETIRHEIVRDDNILTNSEKNEFAKNESHRISLLSGRFVYNGKPLKINISDTVFKDYTYRIEKLNSTEIEILEVASVLGSSFNIAEVSYILNIDSVKISKEIKTIERDGDILRRIDNSGEYIFKKGIYREIFKKRIFSSISFEGDEVPFQLFTEYCNRGVEYFKIKNIKNLSSEEIKRYAHISYYASKKYLKDFITANLEYANYAYTVPELQIDGISSLEKIVIHLNLKKEELLKYLLENNFLNQFISIFSFYIIDFQQLIAGNFNKLNPIVEIFYENHELFYDTFSPEQINHITATYLFSKKPDNIVLQNSINFIKFNERALKECKEEEDILIAKFWEAFLFRKSVKKVKGKDSIKESIKICLNLLKDIDKIKNTFWNRSYRSRILNNLGQSYQINYKDTKNPEDKKMAFIYLNECIAVKEEIKDYTGIAMALGIRSELQDTLENKREDLELGIEYNIRVKNYNGVAYLYGVLEEIMNKNNQPAEALKYKNLKEETESLNRIPSKNQ